MKAIRVNRLAVPVGMTEMVLEPNKWARKAGVARMLERGA
jgi:hypothetical protein